MTSQCATTLWFTLLIISTLPTKINTMETEVLEKNPDAVSSGATSVTAVERRSPDSFPDVVLKGLIIIKIKVSHIQELTNPESKLTRRLVVLCEREMKKLFQTIKGKQTVKIESFRRGRSSTTVVVMDFDSTGNANVSEINDVIIKNIKIPGKFLNYDVERRLVKFKSYGVCCQPKVYYDFNSLGRKEVYDTSGFDNNGVLHGKFQNIDRGKYGKAVKIKYGHISLKSFKESKTQGTNSIVVMFWIMLLNPQSDTVIFKSYYEGSVIALSLERGFLKWQYITQDETIAFQLNNKRLLRPRYWTHVAGLYDPYTRSAKLYIDAELVDESAVRKDHVNWKFTYLMRFGLIDSEGFLDELFVYDCVIGEDIIKKIRKNSLSKERCSPRGKNEYLIRIILVSTNDSRSSRDEITELVESEIQKRFDGISGEQIVQILGYRPATDDSIMVDYWLQSKGNSNTTYLAGILRSAITSGTIANVRLASNDVSFVPTSGKSVCLSSEMKCNDGQCINKLWKCDDEINCADGSDEINCGETIDMNCDENEYQCKTSRLLGISDCVSKNYRCDGQLDCEDDSDEQGCVPPRLIHSPISLTVLAEGETATCTCSASGVPAPKVSWRYKGREVLPKKGKIYVTSVSGRGTLTIFKITKANSGDYICKVRDNRVTKVIAPSCTIKVRAFGKICSQPYFNSAAQRSSECLRCFCHDITDKCRSAQLHKFEISSRWGCVKCNDEEPSLVDKDGRTVSSLSRQDLRAAQNSYYWQLPKKYVGNKLTSYHGNLRFEHDSEFLQRWQRTRRYTGGDHEHEPKSHQIHPTVRNYVLEVSYNGSWFKSKRKPHHNDVPSTNSLPSHKHNVDGDYAMSRPRTLNLTGPYVAVIVGKDGTHLVATKPRYLPDSTVEIEMNEESWKERGKSANITRRKLLRVLSDVEYILINARLPAALIKSLISISLDTAVKQENGNKKVTFVERCACPPGHEGLSCEKCTEGYLRSTQSNRCVKCRCFNHATSCEAGKCQNCLHCTKGTNCEYCKDGYYGNATIGTPNDCKPCACPLEVSTNQFSKLCYLHTDGKQTCSQCKKGYAGRNCERCAEGYEGNPLAVGGNCYKVGNFTRCDLSGSVSQNVTERGEVICTCKTNVLGSTCDQCRYGTFNLQVSNPLGCERCFCSKVSRVCSNFIGSRTKINSAFKEGHFMLTRFSGNLSNIPHSIEDANGETYLRKVFADGHNTKTLYWNIPFKFTGSKVASYGGYLEYTVTNSWNDSKKLRRKYDVLLFIGKESGIIYKGRTKDYVNNQRQTFRVPLKEKFWQFSNRYQVSKHMFVLFLGKIKKILILATPELQMRETRLHDVKMDIAVENTAIASGKPLYSVENCSCPEGYQGYSCENCADGFTRAGTRLLSRCIKCQCNGHSSHCDKNTGECKGCQHNTGGKHCEKCNPGSYGDPTDGSEVACRLCPCPRIYPPNRFSPTCHLGEDGQPVCDQCSEGHKGKRCEKCKESYTGNPLVNGDFCKPVTSCGCDPKGSRSKDCDLKNKKCFCKKNVEGDKCDKCKRGFYNLQIDNEEGCTECFCMGFNTTCRAGEHFREQIKFSIHSTKLPPGLTVATADLTQNTTDVVVDMLSKRVRFYNSTWLQKRNIYWTLPQRFLGNQVKSYGGILRLYVSSVSSSNDVTNNRSIVKIKGNGMTFHYRDLVNDVNEVKVVFLEKHWEKSDGSVVSRYELMEVLVKIDAIMIRTSYSRQPSEISIADIEMNAYSKPGETEALDVELCNCPHTNYGTSCENCSHGYTRLGRTFGHCIPCQCNSHSVECNKHTGVCKNCAHNTAGDKCELCAPGFYADATEGTGKDCKECPCPLPGSSNRFSETCFLDEDGLPTCDSCQEGYSGRRCEKCSLNYTGNPLTPGGKCLQVPVELIPKVKITPESITLQEGDNARFVCNVKTIRSTQVLWSRENWKPFSPRTEVTGNILSIKSLNKSDSGVYVCTATNDIAVRKAQTRLIVKKLQISAVFVTVSPKSRYIPVGGTAKFTCTSKTSSRYSIRWTRENNKPMSSTTSVVDGTLIVDDAKLGDGGTYICTGKNALNYDRAIVSLHVGVVVKPQVSVSPRKRVVDIAETVTFRCSASSGFPAATLRWQRGDGRQLPRFSKFLSRVGVFKIIAASRQDEGEYMCIASNRGGDSVMKVQLLVKGPNSLPRASITPSNSLTAEEGARVHFHCQISGDEQLEVRWSKRDDRLPESAIISGENLEIIKTSVYDKGVYTCTVTNRYGQAEASTRLTVNKDTSKSPKVIINPGGTVISVKEGRSLTLVCHVTGISKPLIQWRRVSKRGYISDGAKLSLKNINVDDTGVYECSVKIGKDQEEKSSVSVVVERNDSLPRVQVRPNEISVEQGGEVTFLCKTDSQLPVKISWSRGNGSPPLGQNHEMRQNVLVIRNVRKDDEGTYICLANNRFGASKATAELTVS